MTDLINFLLSAWHGEVIMYQGYFTLFIASILYLYCVNRKEKMEQGMMWFSMIVILQFCFLPFAQMSISFFIKSEEYFHLLWLLPILPVFGIVFVRYMNTLKKKSQRIIWGIFCVFCIWCAGICPYFWQEGYQERYSPRDPYLEEQVEICTILDAVEGDKLVVVQKEFLPIVRQVSGDIRILYGSDVEEGVYAPEVNDIYGLIEDENIDAELLVKRAKEQGVNYLLLALNWKTVSKPLDELQLEGKLDVIYGTTHYTLVRI